MHFFWKSFEVFFVLFATDALGWGNYYLSAFLTFPCIAKIDPRGNGNIYPCYNVYTNFKSISCYID